MLLDFPLPVPGRRRRAALRVSLCAVLAACSQAPQPLDVLTEADGDARRLFLTDANRQPVAGISCNAPGVKVLEIYFRLDETKVDAKLSLQIDDARFDAVNVMTRNTRSESSLGGSIVLTPVLEKALPDAEKITIFADDAVRVGVLDANSRQFVAEMLRICDSRVR